ncbi:MAG TPA: RNA polymerase sigma factor [Sedimenticola sp.]|nr:RNA polymerase sigma factor [Sedimenticola sp.]
MGLFDRLFRSDLQRRMTDLRPRLQRTAQAWCGCPCLADDLVQEALLKAWRKQHQLKDSSSLDTWLFSILANCCRDHFRRGGEPDGRETGTVPQQRSAEEEVTAEQTVLQVRKAIERLVPGQREVLVLVDLEEFTYAEVGQILGLPLGTVMSRLNRARQRLRLLLESYHRAGPAYLERVK